MTPTIREQVEKLIESKAAKSCHEDDFVDGANLLAGPLVEAMEALKCVDKHYCNSTCPEVYPEHFETMAELVYRKFARETLTKIKKELGL